MNSNGLNSFAQTKLQTSFDYSTPFDKEMKIYYQAGFIPFPQWIVS